MMLLTGCAATPRGNAENACNFAFLAGVVAPLGHVLGAAVCSFGLELIPEKKPELEPEDEVLHV
jgi:hypothetical protein